MLSLQISRSHNILSSITEAILTHKVFQNQSFAFLTMELSVQILLISQQLRHTSDNHSQLPVGTPCE